MLRVISRLVICSSLIKSVFKGQAIIIEDEGKKCKTFVGENISEERFRHLLRNHLRICTLSNN